MASTDWSDFHLFVRTTGPSLELAASVRKAILAVDPGPAGRQHPDDG